MSKRHERRNARRARRTGPPSQTRADRRWRVHRGGTSTGPTRKGTTPISISLYIEREDADPVVRDGRVRVLEVRHSDDPIHVSTLTKPVYSPILTSCAPTAVHIDASTDIQHSDMYRRRTSQGTKYILHTVPNPDLHAQHPRRASMQKMSTSDTTIKCPTCAYS